MPGQMPPAIHSSRFHSAKKTTHRDPATTSNRLPPQPKQCSCNPSFRGWLRNNRWQQGEGSTIQGQSSRFTQSSLPPPCNPIGCHQRDPTSMILWDRVSTSDRLQCPKPQMRRLLKLSQNEGQSHLTHPDDALIRRMRTDRRHGGLILRRGLPFASQSAKLAFEQATSHGHECTTHRFNRRSVSLNPETMISHLNNRGSVFRRGKPAKKTPVVRAMCHNFHH